MDGFCSLLCNAVRTGEEMKLTQSQAIFLRMVQGGSATSNRNNKTAQTLKKLGLVQFNAGLGWSLTPIGVLQLNELKGN